MTLEEAKAYYFKYNGHGFHMMREEPQKDGGVYFILRNTHLASRMQEVMGKLMDFFCDENDNMEKPGWGDAQGRYLRAVCAYERALTKFGR